MPAGLLARVHAADGFRKEADPPHARARWRAVTARAALSHVPTVRCVQGQDRRHRLDGQRPITAASHARILSFQELGVSLLSATTDVTARDVTSDRCLGGGRLAERTLMLSREQELKLLHVERWLRGLPPEEGLKRLARIERALRGSKRPVDKHFVQVIVAWRLHQQLRPA